MNRFTKRLSCPADVVLSANHQLSQHGTRFSICATSSYIVQVIFARKLLPIYCANCLAVDDILILRKTMVFMGLQSKEKAGGGKKALASLINYIKNYIYRTLPFLLIC